MKKYKSIKRQLGFFGISGSAIVGAVGALGAGALAYQGTQDTNEANSENAWLANANAERLSSTAHQREVADLIAAGLNPILSARGSGSATPSMQIPVIQNPMMNAASSARDFLTSTQEAQKTNAQRKQIEQEMRIKEPLDKLAGYTSTGVDTIAQGVKGAVQGALETILGSPAEGKPGILDAVKGATEGLGDKAAAAGDNLLGGIQQTARHVVDVTSAASAKAFDEIGSLKDRWAERMGEIVSAPRKYIEQRANSAQKYYDTATAAARPSPMTESKTINVGRNKFLVDGKSFTGDREKDLQMIRDIQRADLRMVVRQVYQQWQYLYKR